MQNELIACKTDETVAVQSYKPGPGFVANHVAEFSNRLNCVSNLQRQNRKLQILGTLCLGAEISRGAKIIK